MDVPPPQDPPDPGPPGDDARAALALHALADLREQLQGVRRGISGSIAALTATPIADDPRDSGRG